MKRILYPIIALLPLLSACVVENETGGDHPGGDNDLKLSFNVQLPADTRGKTTRALNDSDEAAISTIDVLAFVDDGTDYVYSYKAANVGKSVSGNDITITATAKAYTAHQQFVILINAANELAAANIAPGESIDNVAAKLICTTGSGEWPAKTNNSPAFTHFPMYGKTTPQVVNATNHTIGDFPLLRALSKIDIRLSASIDNFELVNACIFNRMCSAYIGYEQSGFNGTTATTAGVPAGNAIANILSPTVTYNAVTSNDSRGEIINSIYTFEAEGTATTTDRLKATALVVGGKYNGSNTVTYYRIDLKTTSDATLAFSSDLLRNHLYDIVIQSVGGDGAGTAIDAFVGEAQLEAVIKEYNLANQHVIFDGQYKLQVSHARLDFGNEGGTPLLDLHTNYDLTGGSRPKGIIIDDSRTDSWVTITTTGGSAHTTESGWTDRQITVTVGAYDGLGGDVRETSFVVCAGNMHYEVFVTQDKEPWVAVSKNIFRMDDKKQTFNVISKLNWEITAVSDPDNILRGTSMQGLTGGENSLPGDPVSFWVVRDWAKDGMEAEITFRHPLGVCPDKTVTLKAIYLTPNSYLIEEGGSVDISVKNAYNVWAYILPSGRMELTGSLSANLLWEDVNGLVSSVSVLQDIGSQSYVRVTTDAAKGSGNAVVELKEDGVTRWSWHIWVTNDKDVIEAGAGIDNRWMDRNLGRRVNNNLSSTNRAVKGLYYQFGRKDPFILNVSTYPYSTPTLVGSQTSIMETIVNPSIFYYYYQNWTNENTGIEYLWNDPEILTGTNGKSVFDPCPKGWRIPETGAWGTIKNETGWEYTGSGWKNNDYGGAYSLSGHRLYITGEDQDTNRNGNYFSSTAVNKDQAFSLFFSTSTINPIANGSRRASGLNIRCVRE